MYFLQSPYKFAPSPNMHTKTCQSTREIAQLTGGHGSSTLQKKPTTYRSMRTTKNHCRRCLLDTFSYTKLIDLRPKHKEASRLALVLRILSLSQTTCEVHLVQSTDTQRPLPQVTFQRTFSFWLALSSFSLRRKSDTKSEKIVSRSRIFSTPRKRSSFAYFAAKSLNEDLQHKCRRHKIRPIRSPLQTANPSFAVQEDRFSTNRRQDFPQTVHNTNIRGSLI